MVPDSLRQSLANAQFDIASTRPQDSLRSCLAGLVGTRKVPRTPAIASYASVPSRFFSPGST
eukprot:4730552-Pyramimonas_sp.AAC.1